MNDVTKINDEHYDEFRKYPRVIIAITQNGMAVSALWPDQTDNKDILPMTSAVINCLLTLEIGGTEVFMNILKDCCERYSELTGCGDIDIKDLLSSCRKTRGVSSNSVSSLRKQFANSN